MGAGSGEIRSVIGGKHLTVHVGGRHHIDVDFAVEITVNHSGKLAACGSAARRQTVGCFADEYANGNRPFHSVHCVAIDACRIGMAGQIGGFRHIIAFILGIAVQQSRHFLPGDTLSGTEGIVWITRYDFFRNAPSHSVGIVAVRLYVREAFLLAYFRRASHTVQNSRRHRAAQLRLRGKFCIAYAHHIPFAIDKLDG